MKVIAFYLPQFHRTKENDEWWGKGFTEWENMKNAKPQYEGHSQPRIPLDYNYYDLLDDNVKKWQINLAKENGLYGFCVYHYWFEGKQLLQKPMEQYLKNKELDFPFCFSWANETWTNAWAMDAKKRKVLALQTYGEEEAWKRHFEYLLPFFKDKRYIRIDNKPLMVIYRPELIKCLNPMIDLWQKLARENGLAGLTIASQHRYFALDKKSDKSRIDFMIEYQPAFALYDSSAKFKMVLQSLKMKILNIYEMITGKSLRNSLKKLEKTDYDKIWQNVIKRSPMDKKMIPGAFVDWDNTPRYGSKGSVFVGGNPDKFKRYFKEQLVHARKDYEKDMIFIFAWNEWAEGGYLEPDTENADRYLKAIKESLVETGELESNIL